MSFRKGFASTTMEFRVYLVSLLVVKGEREKGRIYGKLLVFN